MGRSGHPPFADQVVPRNWMVRHGADRGSGDSATPSTATGGTDQTGAATCGRLREISGFCHWPLVSSSRYAHRAWQLAGDLIFLVGGRKLPHQFDQFRPLRLMVWQNLQNLDQRHAVPSNCAAPLDRRMVGYRICPWLLSALIVGMKEEARVWVIEVTSVDQQLLCGFIAGILPVIEGCAIPNEEGHGHIHTVQPELVLTRQCVPKSSVLSAGVGVKPFANALGGCLVLLLPGFFEQNQEEIARQHVVQSVDLSVDCASRVDVVVDPSLDIVQIFLVGGSQIDQILSIKIERNGIAPFAES